MYNKSIESSIDFIYLDYRNHKPFKHFFGRITLEKIKSSSTYLRLELSFFYDIDYVSYKFVYNSTKLW